MAVATAAKTKPVCGVRFVTFRSAARLGWGQNDCQSSNARGRQGNAGHRLLVAVCSMWRSPWYPGRSAGDAADELS